MNKNITLKELEEKGYVVLSYHVDMVKSSYDIDDNLALNVLRDAVTRDHEDILLSIETLLT